MIIEFMVENFRSIKSKQIFSLAKSKSDELTSNYFTPDIPGTQPLLKSSAIYGANAAGKSNFINAISKMQEIVSSSAKDTQRGDRLGLNYFKLCDSTIDQPTEFEIVFIANKVKYQYGFSANSNRILDEWLYAYPKSRAQRWFIRAYNVETDSYEWSFSSHLSGKKQLWKDSTRSNSLFLSTSVMLNSEQLRPIFDWLTYNLRVAGINGWHHSYTAEMCQDEKSKEDVLNFLNSADLDISDVRINSRKIEDSSFPDDMPKELKESLLVELKGEEIMEVKTVHKTAQGNEVLFDMISEESDGTNKIFAFAGPWIDALKNGKVLFIDELHQSLHPTMVKFLVTLFHDKVANPNNAQLIFTTHETSILDQDVFRRDQVWFCKKEIDQSTTLYPLTDFSPRKGADNLEKAYLTGRYGALPLISTLDFLGK